jgi:peptidyl-prolyl cis-trans isomerase A (cyclophilin A)
MYPFSVKIWELFHNRDGRRPGSRKPRQPLSRRPELELLEERAVPDGTTTGSISGHAFVDLQNTGMFQTGNAGVPGVVVSLNGTTTVNTPVNATATTDANGSYTFQNVLPGTYTLSAPLPTGLLGGTARFSDVAGSQGVETLSNLNFGSGQSLTEDFGFRGMDPHSVTIGQFLTSTTSANFPFAAAGSGTSQGNFRPNHAPVVSTAIGTVNVNQNAANTVIDLAGHFTDPDYTNSQVTLNTTDGPINITLFDSQAPQTVANFFDYINSGAYNSSIFHRLVSGFVLQGGGFTFQSNPSNLVAIPQNPAVPNEFSSSRSNLLGTVAMAKLGSDPNSATNQFFFNLANNSSNLDNQNGGFTVFGKVTSSADQSVVDQLATTPVQDESQGNSSSPFNQIPLVNYNGTNFPTDTTASNYIMINNVTVDKRDEFLTYKVLSNSNPNLVTATLGTNANEYLTLQYAKGQSGSATITVQATDRFGASVTQTFTVNVTNVAPVATVKLNTSTPQATDTLTATATASDTDGDTVTQTYVWKINNTVVKTTANTSSLTDNLNLTDASIATTLGRAVQPGDSISVSVTPNDGSLNGAVVSALATVASPPT